jgi:zinc transporter ZupT
MLSPINDNINPNNPIVKKLKNGSCGSGGSNINIALTLGMLLYILIFELFNEVRKNLDKKETLLGMVLGVILLFITNLV